MSDSECEDGGGAREQAPQSAHPGVVWDKKLRKWRGKLLDRSVRAPTGKPKQVYVGLFDDENACADAVAKSRAELEAAIAAKLHAMAQDLPHTRGLPLRPANPANAAPDTAYYGEVRHGTKGEAKVFGPDRYVRVAHKSKPSGFEYSICCRADLDSGAPCTSLAKGEGHFCILHGGGPKAGEGGASYCAHCKTVQVHGKRRLCHGGNGLCAGCEARLKAEAAAAGSDAYPAPNERWEDLFFRQLMPKITYEDGTPFPVEQRDERKGGGLGTSSAVKRRRECDTTTNRFPDGLWVRRDRHGRAILVVIVEVDEHSHADYRPDCEAGKIDDTFHALLDKLQKEGAAKGAAARVDAYAPPIVTIKVNPNEYDGPRTPLAKRVDAVVARFHEYAHMTVDELEDLGCHTPIVHVMYYHSKKAATNLAYLATHAREAGWRYTVNK